MKTEKILLNILNMLSITSIYIILYMIYTGYINIPFGLIILIIPGFCLTMLALSELDALVHTSA